MYTHAIALIVGAAIAATGAWQVQEWRMGGQLSTLKADHATSLAQVMAASTKAERAITTTYQGALNASIAREALLRTELDHLYRVSDGLREQSAEAGRRLATAPPAAVLEYAAALGAVHDDCRAAYADLASKATGHASDVRTHREAWPVIPDPPDAGISD
ncbi:hypothetical protein HNP48_002234 [Acidovorax soli]|uniref:Uncharacterized protein n=1 Tax=Acidovorax soli TaxID=592050 RepID=A0A7X0PDH9_9BURK|nr:hypothetical protein [Acidovorax soli]MBB6559567.1 hypothetical protein [Acidovorax soli]